MKKWLSLLIIPICLITIHNQVSAKEIKEDFHRSFDVREGMSLYLKHGDGDVTITPWNKDVVDVKIRYRADIKSFGLGRGEREFDVEFRQTDDAIYVIGKEQKDDGLVIGFHSVKIHEYTYKIQAPDYIKLELGGDDGDVNIEGWRESINCEIDDGDIDFRNIRAPRTSIDSEDGEVHIDDLEGRLGIKGDDGDIFLTSCKTSYCTVDVEDGDIKIRRSQGDFELHSDDGDIDLYQSRPELLDVRTSDGDVEVDLLKTDRLDVDITTDDGDVMIDLERGTSVSFLIDSGDGDITVNIPDIENYEESRHTKLGEIHGGKGRIRVSTSDGDIILREY